MGNLKKLVAKIMEEENIPLHRMRAHLEACGYRLYEVNARGDALQKGVPQKYSVEDIERANALRVKGLSLSKIALKMDVPVGSVPYLLELSR